MADYQARFPELQAAGVDVLFASGDSEQDAQRTVEELRPGFPVAFGLDPRSFAAATGCFWSEQKNHLQATGFLLRPGGRVVLAVYSSGALGRLSVPDVLTILPYLRPKDQRSGDGRPPDPRSRDPQPGDPRPSRPPGSGPSASQGEPAR